MSNLLNRAVGRVSQFRRRRFVGAAMLLAALGLTGVTYAAVAPASSADAGQSQTAKIAAGRQLFLVSCAFCHGQNAEGVTTVNPGQQVGPSLIGVGAASVDFQVSTGRMPMEQPGAQVEKKRNVFSEAEVEQLAAYVASLGAGPAIPSKNDYDPSTIPGNEKNAAIALGGTIFLTNCTACHNYTGEGGAMPRGGKAPTLLHTDPKYIYEAMLTGPQSMDTFSNGNISPAEKKAVIAYIESMKDQPKYGGFALGNLGPVAEGLIAWVVGIGGMLGFAVWIAAHTTRTNKKKDA